MSSTILDYTWFGTFHGSPVSFLTVEIFYLLNPDENIVSAFLGGGCSDLVGCTEMTMMNQTDILLREVGVRANAIIGRQEVVAAT